MQNPLQNPMQNQKTIGIFAPANPITYINPQLIDQGIRHLNTLGFNIKFGKNVYAQMGHTAGTVLERLADFNALLIDDSVDILMPVYGGYNTNHLLDLLDYAEIKKQNKIIMGYSDITALLNAIYAKTGLITYHGPAFISFCNPTVFPEFIAVMQAVINTTSQNKIFSLNESLPLSNDQSLPLTLTAPQYYASDDWYLIPEFQPREVLPHAGWFSARAGTARGILIGGNLETLLALAGTPYLPDFTDKILLIESIEKNPAKFDRDLTQLKLMGVFEQIKGLIVGQFPQQSKLAYNEILLPILNLHIEQALPILINTHFSHVDPLYTLPIGGEIELAITVKSQKIIIF